MQADIDFDGVTAGLRTKSEKIRALAREGAATADIARRLGLRYQHARNVLVESGLHARRRLRLGGERGGGRARLADHGFDRGARQRDAIALAAGRAWADMDVAVDVRVVR